MNKRFDRETLRAYKEDIGYGIVGSYIRGISKDITNLDNFSDNKIGEIFCKFGESKVDILDPDSMVKVNSFIGDPDKTYPLAESVKLAYDKLDEFLASAEAHNFSLDKIEEGLNTYANKIGGVARELAFGEGDTSEDIKQNLRVLLKIGIDEFDKRAKEDEAIKEQEANDDNMAEADDADMDTENQGGEDDSDYQDDGGEFDENAVDDEFGDDNDTDDNQDNDEFQDDNDQDQGDGSDEYEQEANEEFGSDDEDQGDDDQGNGSAEASYFSNFGGMTGLGEDSQGYGEKLNYSKLLKQGYKIPNLTKEEEYYFKSIANYGIGNFWEAVKRKAKVLKHKVYSGDKYQTESGHLTTKDVNFIEDFNNVSVVGYFKMLTYFAIYALAFCFGWNIVAAPLFAPVALVVDGAFYYLTIKAGKFLMKFSYENDVVLQQHVKIFIEGNERAIEIYKNIKAQAKAKGDTKTIKRCEKMIFQLEKDNNTMRNEWKVTFSEGKSYEDVLKTIENRNVLANHSSDLTYLVNGQFTSMSERDMKDIVSDLKVLEEDSYKALSESNGYLSPQAESQHKSTIQLYATIATIKNNLGL